MFCRPFLFHCTSPKHFQNWLRGVDLPYVDLGREMFLFRRCFGSIERSLQMFLTWLHVKYNFWKNNNCIALLKMLFVLHVTRIRSEYERVTAWMPNMADWGGGTCIAQIQLRRLSPKLPRGESRGHKSRKSRTHVETCRDVCDKVRDKSATNPFVSL